MNSDNGDERFKKEGDLDSKVARSLLDQLFTDSRLYTKSKDYKELLDFVVRLRNFAPFNAMLLQIQKPGLRIAASARDWKYRFDRTIKDGSRPLLILQPFGPVALVYDVQDTEGQKLPQDVTAFSAFGVISEARFNSFEAFLRKKNIELLLVDGGDNNAGLIRVIRRATKAKELTLYRIHLNRNHQTAVQFVTLAHELGHLFLGHLGQDRERNVPQRPIIKHAQRELEAESVAYLVCNRNGVSPNSQKYLSSYVDQNNTIDQIDIYQVMRAAGQVETLLGLSAHKLF